MLVNLTLKPAALALVLALTPAVSQAQQSVRADVPSPGGQTYAEAVHLLASAATADVQTRAIPMLKAAVEQGNPDAMFVLAALYAKGRLVGRDPATARNLYRQAAERNHDKARNALALMLLQDPGGTGEVEAATLFQKASDNGLIAAKANLGSLYLDGRGVARQPEMGATLIREAAEAGLPHAQHNYARLLEAGDGVEVDSPGALKWYGAAAESGVPEAQFNLALMEARGDGMNPDPVNAMKWLMIAASGSRGELRRQVDMAILQLAATLEPPQVAEAGEKANLWLIRNRLQGPVGTGG